LDWLQDPNISYHAYAGFGVLVLFVIFSGLILLYWLLFKMWDTYQSVYKYYRVKKNDVVMYYMTYGVIFTVVIISVVSVGMNILWSFTGRWRFPDIFPSEFSMRVWQLNWDSILTIVCSSVMLAFFVTTISLIITIVLLETMTGMRTIYRKWVVGFFLMLLVIPQIMVMFGLSTTLLYFGFMDYYYNTIYGHVLYSITYMMLIMNVAYERYDIRYSHMSMTLGKSALYTFWHIKLRLILKAIIIASAIGFTVSISQYVPTLFLGGGRVETLSLETISVFSGANRRLMGLYGMIQGIIPLLIFGLAMLSIRRMRI
jgi:putative thiamine transport system permease protein